MKMMEYSPALAAKQLRHCYGRKIALDSISFQASTGVTALLGPNGAGKTTLLRILATVQRPTSGQVTWEGNDILRHPMALRRALGYLPQRFSAPSTFTGREVLTSVGAMRGLSAKVLPHAVTQALAATHLHDVADQRVGSYSGGMLRRLGIAQALVHSPKVLLIDEPTAGLDPEERLRFRALMTTIAHERTVIFSTHIVSDVETQASRVLLLRSGRLILDDTLPHVLTTLVGRIWQAQGALEAIEALKMMPGVVPISTTQEPSSVTLRFFAQPSSFPIPAVSVSPTLEDVYITAQSGVMADTTLVAQKG
jgi:ABC-2 type transport system ATP-binding protein